MSDHHFNGDMGACGMYLDEHIWDGTRWQCPDLTPTPNVKENES